uniref:Uncharacterized protein n=1 Tax=Anopheles atroparvus TaxID=41427 RepID=A0AAG5D5Y5_ANOAO
MRLILLKFLSYEGRVIKRRKENTNNINLIHTPNEFVKQKQNRNKKYTKQQTATRLPANTRHSTYKEMTYTLTQNKSKTRTKCCEMGMCGKYNSSTERLQRKKTNKQHSRKSENDRRNPCKLLHLIVSPF